MKTRVVTILFALVMSMSVYAITPQERADMNAVLASMRAEKARTQDAASSTLDGIAAAMRSENEARDRRMDATLSSIAAIMRRDIASGLHADNDAASANPSDITYSTMGVDARTDIASNATTASTNPFIMGSYAVGSTFASPGARPYLSGGKGGAQSPVPGALTSGYGYRPSFGRMHHGVDLALRTGDTVRAAYDGKVVLVSNDPKGYGRYVKLKHDGGMETLYAHFTHPLVRHGQSVRAGEPIGIGGATGNATGPHLHFETRVGGVAVDPTRFFDFSRGGGARKNATPLSDGPRRTNPVQPQNDRRELTQPRSRLKTQTVATASKPSGTLPRTATYQVRRGDSLEKIAREHGMTVGEICRLNKMSKYTPMYTGKVIRLK